MDFALPADLVAYLDELDRFIAREIKPLDLVHRQLRAIIRAEMEGSL